MNLNVERMCHGKRRYWSEVSALIVAAKRQTSYPLRAYECPNCNGWHLTKKVDKSVVSEAPEVS